MVLDAALLNTQHYRVRIKGKVEQSRERSSVIAIEKGVFRSPVTNVANFTIKTYDSCQSSGELVFNILNFVRFN